MATNLFKMCLKGMWGVIMGMILQKAEYDTFEALTLGVFLYIVLVISEKL